VEFGFVDGYAGERSVPEVEADAVIGSQAGDQPWPTPE